MIKADAWLRKRCRIYTSAKRIETKKRGNILQVVSSDGRRQHGHNPSLVLMDEVHTQPNRDLYDALTSAFGARRDPLTILISTAGNRRDSLLYEEYQYACKVRDGLIDDPEYLPIIYEAGPDDDWTDEAIWHKAMPALGDFANLDFIRSECRKAKEMPSEESKFRQLYLNQWVASVRKWLNRSKWDACGTNHYSPAELLGRSCYGGLDLSAVSDITAFVLVFPMDDGTFRVLCRFWLPESYAAECDRKGLTKYLQWARQGLITLTDGHVIDHDLIFDEVVALCEAHDVRMVRIDKFTATQTAVKLMNKGIPVEMMRQGTISMNEPTCYLEVLIARELLHHGDNAVLNWMADNAVSVRDSQGNIKISKDKSAGKVDGMVALTMGIAAAIVDVPPAPPVISFS
jgi:phage terminase large subunit-like protein